MSQKKMTLSDNKYTNPFSIKACLYQNVPETEGGAGSPKKPWELRESRAAASSLHCVCSVSTTQQPQETLSLQSYWSTAVT